MITTANSTPNIVGLTLPQSSLPAVPKQENLVGQSILGKVGGFFTDIAKRAVAADIQGGLVGRDAPETFAQAYEMGKKKRSEFISSLSDPNKVGDIAVGFSPIGNIGSLGGEMIKQTVAKKLTQKALERERGFVTSAKEILPEATKIAGQYIPRSTDELSIKASNFIKENAVNAEKIAMTGSDENAVAIASELIKKYGDDARRVGGTEAIAFYDKAADIANTMARKLTESGRTVQAASILGRLTPEGQVRFAAREIQRYNETVSPARRLPELSGEKAGEIIQKAKQIDLLPDGLDKRVAFQKLQEEIQALVPTPLIKKITAVWKAGLLTGIKTTGLNVFSNLSHAVSETVKDVPAAVVDSVASLFTGKRTLVASSPGTSKGVKEGFQKGLEYFKTGYDERNIASKLDYNKINFGKGKVAKAFQTYTDTVFRVMGTSDQPFYYGALSRSIGNQATARGINEGLKGKELKIFVDKILQNPDEEILRYATADALQAVFQNETYLGKAAKALQNVPVVGEIAVPFSRTPAAVATQIINYTPVGVTAEIIKQIVKKEFNQRVFSQAVGRGITGVGVLYLGGKLFEKGMVSLDRPKTEREQKLWELEGRKANSILIDGKWRSPTVLGPAGNLLLIGGHFKRAFTESGSPSEAMSRATFGGLKSFTEQTFLTGINQLSDALNDPERFGSTYIGSLVSSFVPTLVSDVARANDPLERRTGSIKERIQARIPVAREKLEPQITVLGEKRQSVGNPLEIMIDPTRPSPVNETPVIKELRKITKAGYPVSPTLLGDKKGYSVLSPKENTLLWERAGLIINDKLESLFANEEYKKLDNEGKGKLINYVIDKAKVVARTEAVLKLTEGMEGEQLREILSRLKKGELLTKQVFDRYVELR